MTRAGRRLSLDKPATYRIEVQGQLDASWSPRLGGMAVHATIMQEQGPVTTLEGTLLDQAALAGVLNALCMLGLPVISVEYVPADLPERSADLPEQEG